MYEIDGESKNRYTIFLNEGHKGTYYDRSANYSSSQRNRYQFSEFSVSTQFIPPSKGHISVPQTEFC